MNNMQKKQTFRGKYVKKMTELRRGKTSNAQLNMDEPVTCIVEEKVMNFKTRREAMDVFLQGALKFEGTYECIASNIMIQLMLGWKRCSDTEAFMD